MRPRQNGRQNRRRRECVLCQFRFTTCEAILEEMEPVLPAKIDTEIRVPLEEEAGVIVAGYYWWRAGETEKWQLEKGGKTSGASHHQSLMYTNLSVEFKPVV